MFRSTISVGTALQNWILSVCVCVCVSECVCVCVCEREREREAETETESAQCDQTFCNYCYTTLCKCHMH